MTGSGSPSATWCTNASCSPGRKARQVGAQDDRPQVGLERLARLEARRLVGQPAFDVDEARRVQAAHGRHRRLEVDVAQPAVADPWRGPAGPTRCCRPRRTARRASRRAASRLRGSGTARRGPAPSGTSRSRGWRRPGRRSARAAPRSATTYATRSPNRASRSRVASTIAADPSRAMTDPCGSRSASISVTRPLPHPASSTRSSPSSGRRSRTTVPQRRHRVGDAVVGPGVPVAWHPGVRHRRSVVRSRGPTSSSSSPRGSARAARTTTPDAPTTSRPAQTHIASWKAAIEAWFEAATCDAVAPAPGGLSGWNIRLTALSVVSRPVDDASEA